MYKPYHLIGLELGISVASAALRGKPTGAPTGFRGDVVATAKRDLARRRDARRRGRLSRCGASCMPAADSLALGALPIGLAHHVTLKVPVAAGTPVRWSDVAFAGTSEAVSVRREMERDARTALGLREAAE